MTEGIDYSDARPGGAAIKAAGKSFVFRYVEYPAAGGKGLKQDELADLRANGLAVGMVYESDGLTPLQGASAGDHDAREALAGLLSIGWPTDRPCYFAVDTDARSNEQLSAIDAYLSAAANILGGPERIGIYGGIRVVDHCLQAKTAAWGWQTYAWSGGQVSTLAHVLQYANGQQLNGDVDFCRSLKDDFGQWPKPEEELDVNGLARLDRLEAIVIGNGFDAIPRPGCEELFPAGTVIVPEGQDLPRDQWVRLTGENAVEYAKRRGFSLALAIESK